jgi:cytochrome b involved in lipid metabolism
MEEIQKHNTEDDCWLAVYDEVYDVTKFLDKHPGGKKVMFDLAGKDGTDAFEKQKHDDWHLLRIYPYFIGYYPDGKPDPPEDPNSRWYLGS